MPGHLTYLRSIEIPIPPLPEQQAIAHALGTLDDKIELNRRMNRTLEEMARAIFKDWFVDFGPTRAKIEGQEPYLPPELWDLFPDQLVDSGTGGDPRGVGDQAPRRNCQAFLNGLALQKYPPNEGPSLPVIKIAQLRAGQHLTHKLPILPALMYLRFIPQTTQMAMFFSLGQARHIELQHLDRW